ncbi:MAG TPA: YncE family protein [Acidobacteriaceae bacterium]|nr:YncE family protein [Acidobacteriaceae bacterium]
MLAISLAAAASGCQSHDFPTYPANYREYAYISNSGSNTVTILDVVNMRQDRVLAVGRDPSGVAANPLRQEVYVVNTGSGTISVIDARTNKVAGVIGVNRQPYSIDVDVRGRRAYVANSGSNNISVIDLEARRQIGVISAGESPGLARITPDGNALVISNRASGSVSIADPRSFLVRSSFDRCPGATDIAILPDSSKALIACSGGHQVMVLGLAHGPGREPAAPDRLLTFLDVGKTPVQIALKPDGGEAFVSNFDSGTISEIATQSNEAGGASLVGYHPVRGVVSADNSLLYVSNFSAGMVSIYSIDDGKLLTPIKIGEGPDALAFSADGRFLFVVNAQSGDVSALLLHSQPAPPSLITMFPAGSRPSGIAIAAFQAR